MTRSRRRRTVKWLPLLVAAVLIWGAISGWLRPVSQTAAEWATPYLVAASMSFGRYIASLLIPGD